MLYGRFSLVVYMNCAYHYSSWMCFFILFYQSSFLFHAPPTDISNEFSLESSGPVIVRHTSEDPKVVARSFCGFNSYLLKLS